MKILALDTSSRYGSLALCEGPELRAEYTTLGVVNQSERLLAQIDRLLADVGWKIADIEGFAVVHGPGSFTGVRVGLATIQGLAFATGRPALGISSLKALALGQRGTDASICPVLDARKAEIYTALYRWIDGELTTVLAEQAVDPARFLSRLEGPVLFVGDGVPAVSSLVEGLTGVQARWLEGSSGLCRASVIAAWAARELARSTHDGSSRVQPHYLRPAEAELKLRPAGQAPPQG